MSAVTTSSRFEPGTLVTVQGHGDLAFQVVKHDDTQLVVVRVDGRGRPRRVAGDVQPFALDELRLETVARRGRVEHDADAPTSTRTQLPLFDSEPHD